MRAVQNHLVAGVSMNGAHDTALDRCVIIQSLCHRCKAVCGTRSSRDDLIISGQSLLVYGINDGLQIVTCRSGNNNLLSTSLDMSHGLLFGAVETGTLKNYINTDLSPRKLVSLCHSINLQGLTVNSDGTSLIISFNSVKIFTDSSTVSTLCGIIL